MKGHYSNDYYAGIVAGIGTGLLVCRACQNQGWMDVGSHPVTILGGILLWGLGLVCGWRRHLSPKVEGPTSRSTE
ncbi:MAG: hypothetical protein FJ276_32335 [Planctomycetes bacterium]|nr:hypothetical protein [Planctomycetota bacterium]